VWRMRVGVRFIYSGRRVLRGTGMAMVATVLQQLKGVGEVLGLDSVVWGSLRASWRSRRWTGACGRRQCPRSTVAEDVDEDDGDRARAGR
jgi:hypothetical protein